MKLPNPALVRIVRLRRPAAQLFRSAPVDNPRMYCYYAIHEGVAACPYEGRP